MSMHLKHTGAHAQAVNKCNAADDVLVRLDSAGFIVNASQNAIRLGLDVGQLLVMPHIADLFDPDVQAAVTGYFDQVIAGGFDTLGNDAGVEFPLLAVGTGKTSLDDPINEAASALPPQEWYSLKLVRVEADQEGTYGALGTLRSVQDKYAIRIGPAPDLSIDSVTGLSARRGFAGRLTQSIALGEADSIALFAIDGMKSIYMNYGQGTADEVRWGFARFLEAVTEQEHFLAQVDDERFGVILPRMTPRQAREWAADALQLFASLTVSPAGRGSELTASAGIAPAQISAEWSQRQAELGLIMARSAGGMQTGYCRSNAGFSNGDSVERAIERAAEQAVQQANRRAS